MTMRAVCRSVLFIAAYFAFALVLVLNVDAKSHDPEWKSFTSIKSFTVDYPSSWVSIDKSGIRLNILSSAARLTAVVIARGESEITVDELRPPPRNGTYPRYLEEYYDTTIYDYRTITTSWNEYDNACHAIDIGSADFEIAPGAIQAHTMLTCRIGARWFEVRVTRWKADGKSMQDEKAALRMIDSLRVTAP